MVTPTAQSDHVVVRRLVGGTRDVRRRRGAVSERIVVISDGGGAPEAYDQLDQVLADPFVEQNGRCVPVQHRRRRQDGVDDYKVFDTRPHHAVSSQQPRSSNHRYIPPIHL